MVATATERAPQVREKTKVSLLGQNEWVQRGQSPLLSCVTTNQYQGPPQGCADLLKEQNWPVGANNLIQYGRPAESKADISVLVDYCDVE